MKKNLTKEEYIKWREKHKSEELYEFYDSNDKSLFKEWRIDRNSASNAVKASNGKISYYKEVPIYIVQNKDGTYNIHESIINDIDDDKSKETLYDKAIWFVYRVLDKVHQVISFIKDTNYYFKTYKKKSVHDRNIWYCLNSHILEDLRWNLPKLRDESHGYPGNLNNAKEWKDKIDDMLLAMQSYFIYKELYGQPQKECPEEWSKLGQKFIDNYKNLISNIPYYENSHDINYEELNDLVAKSWDDMWNWMKQWGSDLWD